MNRFVVFVLASLLLSAPAMAFDGVGEKTDTANQAVVFFVGFEVELFVPVSEADIERRGCRGFIDRRAFLKELQPNQSREKYDNRDVRGEVVFSENTRYFIGRDGVVRLGDKEFLLDKQAFSDAVKLAGKC